MVVEVADTTVEYDRELKLLLYARAGIGEVWLVDLESATIEVYRQPKPEGYRDSRRVRRFGICCAQHAEADGNRKALPELTW